ncbi:Caffeine dehydrogenase subunit gamma [Hyphomicrobiales bacterium]|nr:Caffeine dehydrogenase subunit gamma [Hyphomicrobiales bacterium]CAH1691398.1 Caffeine dehydrogenase subunit gamma [Hyphomicrobiales bacterium]
MNPEPHNHTLSLRVNGRDWRGEVAARQSLADFLRERMNLTGTHLGCEHGVCGACTIMIDGIPQRSCLTLTVQVEGRSITTVEGLEGPVVDALRDAFSECHALQCGFCTPGMLVTALDVIARGKCGSDEEIRGELSGNLCRCTGYQGIVKAIRTASERIGHE